MSGRTGGAVGAELGACRSASVGEVVRVRVPGGLARPATYRWKDLFKAVTDLKPPSPYLSRPVSTARRPGETAVHTRTAPDAQTDFSRLYSPLMPRAPKRNLAGNGHIQRQNRHRRFSLGFPPIQRPVGELDTTPTHRSTRIYIPVRAQKVGRQKLLPSAT